MKSFLKIIPWVSGWLIGFYGTELVKYVFGFKLLFPIELSITCTIFGFILIILHNRFTVWKAS